MTGLARDLLHSRPWTIGYCLIVCWVIVAGEALSWAGLI